jgi:YVTN family beta-propeller protein
MLVVTGVLAILAVALPVASGAKGKCFATQHAGRLGYTAQLRDNTVSVLDLATQKPVGTLTGFNFPFNTEVSPTGSKLYVDNAGAHNVEILNLCTEEVIKQIPVNGAPFSSESLDGRYIISTVPDGTILRISIATDEVRIYHVPPGSLHAVTATGRVIWVSAAGPNNTGLVYTIDGRTGAQFGATATVGNTPATITMAPDASRVVTFNLLSHGDSVVNTATRKVTNVSTGDSSTPAYGKISPDSRYLWSGDYANFVHVIDLETGHIVKTFDTGGFAVGVNFSRNGSKTYVSTTNPGTTTAGQGLAALQEALANTWTPGGRIWVFNTRAQTKIGEFSSGGNVPMVVAIPKEPLHPTDAH